jgi:inosose dehydratase
MKRRHFLTVTSAAAVTVALAPRGRAAARDGSPHIATNTYPWGTFARRDGKTFVANNDDALALVASSGIKGYEPAITAAAAFDGLAGRLKQHGLEMRSLYVNSVLHDPALAEKSIADVLTIARRAGETGTKIIVTNPSPLRGAGTEAKTDAQLRGQAQALDRLGVESRSRITITTWNCGTGRASTTIC